MQQYSNLLIVFALASCPSFVIMAAKGPYEAIIYNITSCTTQQPWFRYNVSTYTNHGRALVRGNFVTNRDVRDPKFNVKMHYMEPGKADPIEVRNMSCHHIIARVVLRTLGLRYNSQKCTMKATSAVFDSIDFDAILHTVEQTLCHGTIHIRWEVALSANPFMCLDCYLQIVKTIDMKNK